MQAQFQIHFTDSYGTATIACYNEDQYRATYKQLQEDPECDNIWTEYYDEEEGWQA